MKSKLNSLSNNYEFKSMLKGKKISNKYSTIFFKKLPNKEKDVLNISFVVKKKVGNSVVRNKIKRRLRNIMYEAVKKNNLKLYYCYLLIAKRSLLTDKYIDIKNELFKKFLVIR